MTRRVTPFYEMGEPVNLCVRAWLNEFLIAAI